VSLCAFVRRHLGDFAAFAMAIDCLRTQKNESALQISGPPPRRGMSQRLVLYGISKPDDHDRSGKYTATHGESIS
jgi:hypothetical protein